MRSNRVLAGALVGAAVIACAVFIRPAPGTERQWTVKVAPGPPPLHATPATLKRVFAGAQAGETIRSRADADGAVRRRHEGRHGHARPRTWCGRVDLDRVRPGPEHHPRRASDHRSADRREQLEHLTVRDSHFDGAQAVIRTGELAHADILFEGNSHAGFDKCASCYEGRLQLVDRGDKPSGVTIRNSVFGPVVLGRHPERRLRRRDPGQPLRRHPPIDGDDGVHSDAIQLYGSSGTVIPGNQMLRVAADHGGGRRRPRADRGQRDRDPRLPVGDHDRRRRRLDHPPQPAAGRRLRLRAPCGTLRTRPTTRAAWARAPWSRTTGDARCARGRAWRRARDRDRQHHRWRPTKTPLSCQRSRPAGLRSRWAAPVATNGGNQIERPAPIRRRT